MYLFVEMIKINTYIKRAEQQSQFFFQYLFVISNNY